MIVGTEIHLGWGECLAEVVQPFGIGADEIVNSLVRIGECNQSAELPQSPHHSPLFRVGVLKFIQDYEGIRGGHEPAHALAAMKTVAHAGCEEVETDPPTRSGKPEALGLFPPFFFSFSGTAQLALSVIATADHR